MWHLFLLEWKKFNKNVVVRVLMIMYLVIMPGIFILINAIPKPEVARLEIQSFFMFPNIWQYLGFAGNWAVFFLFGFAMILSVTTEYSNKTMRQNIITGLTRRDYFLAKFSWAVALSAGATLYYALCCLVIGFLQTDTIYASKLLQEIQFIPRYFLMSLGYMSFALLIGLLLRRTGLALIVYLMYNIALEPLIRYGIHMRYFDKGKSIHFYPMNSMEDLVPVPFLDMIEDFIEENNFTFLLEPNEAIITASIYTGLFFFLSYYLLQKRDL